MQLNIITPSSWIGAIKMGDANPELIFNIFKDNIGVFVGNLSVPSKGVKEIPLSKVTIEQDFIILEIEAAQASYKGVLAKDKLSIDGVWKEGGNSFQLRLLPLTEEIDYDNFNNENVSSLNLEATSDNFNFYSEKKDAEVLDRLSKALEMNYSFITDHLKTKFDEKIKVYIYPDIKSFHMAINYPDAPDWVVGAASKNELKLVSPLNSGSSHSYESLMQAIVHEFAHAVVLNIREHGLVGIPNWLNEGFAYYEAGQLTDTQRKSIHSKLLKNKIPTWHEMKQANAFQFGDMEGYGLSATIIEFLVETYGFDKLRQFIIEPDSVEMIYKVSEKELEIMWLKYLGVHFT